MPDRSSRLVTMPGWAWREWDRLAKDYQESIVDDCWFKEFENNFAYFLTARMHMAAREGKKILYQVRYQRAIPGGCSFRIANDFFDPRELPRFPDPFWKEMPYKWLEANGLAALPYRYSGFKPPWEIDDPNDLDLFWIPCY